MMRDGLSPQQLAMLVREINISGFFQSSDDLFVRLEVSDDRFSKLIRETVDGRTIYEIRLNLPGVVFISNLARCLLGDHSDPAVYVDSVLGATCASFSDEMDLNMFEIVTILERNKPVTFRAVRDSSKSWGSFPSAAKEVRKIFYSVFSDLDHNQFCLEAVARFIIGHELGHYMKHATPDLANALIHEIKVLSPCDIDTDTELFCDIVGILHSLNSKIRKNESLRPTIVILAMITTFFDSLSFSGFTGSGRKSFSYERYNVLQAIADKKYNNQDIVVDLMSLSMNYNAILYPISIAMNDVFSFLHKRLRDAEYESNWSLRASDF